MQRNSQIKKMNHVLIGIGLIFSIIVGKLFYEQIFNYENILNKAINRLDRELDIQDTIPVNQLSTVIGTLYDKNRLEKGESTENTNQTIKIGFSDEIQELSK